jgi:hypothetical protein
MFERPPTILHTTSFMREDETAVLLGQDADYDLVVYYSDKRSKWVMQNYTAGSYLARFDCVISVAGDTLYTFGYPVNFKPAWVGATLCLYYDVGGSWVLRPKGEMAYSLPEDDSEVYGFWTYTGADPTTATFTAAGTETADATANINAWARWECDTMVGEYAAAGGASGTKRVGAAVAVPCLVAEVAIWRT